MSSLDTFPLDPDFTIPEEGTDGVARTPALSGKRGQRIVEPDARIWNLVFAERATDEVEQVRDWWERFKDSYFIFNHKIYVNNAGTYLPRKFPVIFGGRPRTALDGHETTRIEVQLIEAVGRELGGNYLRFGDRFENAVWGGNASGVAVPTVAPDTVNDSRGLAVADAISFPLTGGGQFSEWIQSLSGLSGLRGMSFDFFVRLKAASATTILLEIKDNPYSTTFVSESKNIGTGWAEFMVSGTVPTGASDTGITVALLQPANQAAKTIHALRARLSISGAAAYADPIDSHPTRFIEAEAAGTALSGTWSKTLAGHGGQRLDNNNTNTTDAFQWTYEGYGFALWGTRWDNLGIAELFLDGVSLGLIDFYGPNTDNVPLFEKWDVPLGLHRVKLVATNTKNGASSANTINADAIEVMY